jgi:SAM-dependent methyltransferase
MDEPLVQRHFSLSPLLQLLRCLECGSRLESEEAASEASYPELGPDGWLACTSCQERYPVIGGTVRMLDRRGRARLADAYPEAAARLGIPRPEGTLADSVRDRTAESFAYEWAHFGQPRAEWTKNFLDYMRPHSAEYFAGKVVLDVGAGSGRHSAQAAQFGARVVAVDLGRSIDVARRNLPPSVLTVQADAERLPLRVESFDFVMSVGVLHHLPDTEGALASLVPYVAPGGNLHVYLYWVPEVRWHRTVLKLVDLVRRGTIRMPHALLRQLCYPLSAVLWLTVVLPYRTLVKRPKLAKLAEALPLKTYSAYPFGVLVNDQFDRFSAPIEQRFTKSEVSAMLIKAGLDDVVVVPNSGWVADGRRVSADARASSADPHDSPARSSNSL